eukprot:9148756-Prorocentrum_lima.AAC.1
MDVVPGNPYAAAAGEMDEVPADAPGYGPADSSMEEWRRWKSRPAEEWTAWRRSSAAGSAEPWSGP